jgi:hypothetical protein
LGVELTSAATIDGPTCAESVRKVKVAAGARRRLDRTNSDLPTLTFAVNKIDVGMLLESLAGARRPL